MKPKRTAFRIMVEDGQGGAYIAMGVMLINFSEPGDRDLLGIFSTIIGVLHIMSGTALAVMQARSKQ